jgi:hypothetical protein
MLNTIPYIYDKNWRDYLIEYYKFQGYQLIKDLSKFSNDISIIILIFKKDDNTYLFGYNDGIVFPLLKQDNIIYNFNSEKYKNRLNNILNNIINEIKLFYNGEIKIYNYVFYQFNLRFNLFSYLNFNTNTVIEYIRIINNEDITDNIKPNIKNKINSFIKGKIFNEYNINIFYGNIEEEIFNNFIEKHYILAEKHTKSIYCWNILKKFINDKKAFLIKYNNDYIYFFICKDLSYYGINACTRKSDICIILLYKAFIFTKELGCKFIYLGNENKDTYKLENISFFKKSLSNTMLDNNIIII